MTFILRSKQVLITYTHCPLTKEYVLQKLKEKVQVPIKEYIICIEKHKDGDPHLHCYIAMDEVLVVKDSRFFDIDGYHPNIKEKTSAKAQAKAKGYCKKENDYITNIDVAVNTPRTELLNIILKHGRLDGELLRMYPEVMNLNFNSIKGWLSLIRKEQFPVAMYPKKRHIWLYGPSNSGKSTWLRAYLSLVDGKINQLPYNNDYNGLDEETEWIYADEFRGQVTIQQLNLMADGYCKLNVKGSSTFIREVRKIIIVSNYSIVECYKNTSDEIIKTLKNRFSEFDSEFKFPRMPYMEL